MASTSIEPPNSEEYKNILEPVSVKTGLNDIEMKIQITSLRFGWLVILELTALRDSISVYIGPSPREREKEKRSDRWEKKCPNNPHLHLLQAQKAPALL